MFFELDVKKTVKKSNMLNELRNANTSMAEYRLFCVYLAHVPMNSDNNEVTFKLADYARIVGLDRPRKEDLEMQAHNIVSRTAQIDDAETGGFEVVPIFQRFKLTHESDGWYVTLACNNDIAPMIREQKGKFLRYKLYNTIYLKSYNQQRIYELLKQYEKAGARVIDLKDLRSYLSIADHEYPVWYDFSSKVLKVAQKALKENTDIYFEYEPIKKGRPVVAVKFNIYKNDAFIDQLRIDDFIHPEEVEEFGEASYEGDEIDVRSEEYDANQMTFFDYEDKESDIPEHLVVLAENLPEFSIEKLDLLCTLADEHVPVFTDGPLPRSIQICDFILEKVKLMNSQRKPVAKEARFTWLSKAVKGDWQP